MDRRAVYRKGLSPTYLPYYDALSAILGDHWQPVSGIRSLIKQGQLYAMGRTAPGKIVTNAKPGLSLHNYGFASDWDHFDGDQYAPLSFEDPLWKEYEDACEKVGLRCLSFEKPHNELPTTSRASEFYAIFLKDGMLAVQNLVKEEMKNGRIHSVVSI